MYERYRTAGYVCRVREVRVWRGLSMEQLSRKAGCSSQSIRNIEKMETVPNVFLALRISDALQIPLEKLFIMEKEVDHATAQT